MLEQHLIRAWEQLAGRIGGPLSFRLLLQPTVAVILGVRAGLRDANAGRPAYLWSILRDSTERRILVRGGWLDVARLTAMAIGVDALYQLIELHWFYPLQAIAVAVLLAVVPYLLVRGPANRLASRRRAVRNV